MNLLVGSYDSDGEEDPAPQGPGHPKKGPGRFGRGCQILLARSSVRTTMVREGIFFFKKLLGNCRQKQHDATVDAVLEFGVSRPLGLMPARSLFLRSSGRLGSTGSYGDLYSITR